MSRIHYFQRYSQPENVMTNNALLFLGRIYEMGPRLFNHTLNNLLGDDKEQGITVGVSMVQQERNEQGVPDGMLEQQAFRIVVETKRGKNFDLGQLKRHAEMLNGSGANVLLLLSPEALTELEMKDLLAKLALPEGVRAVSVSFENLITSANDANVRADPALEELVEDFRDYCSAEDILPVSKYWMRAITAGWTYDHNQELGLYYDLASRGYSEHAYLGLYWEKGVRAVGEIVDTITADMVDGELVNVRSEMKGTPLPEHLDRIKRAIPIAKEGPGYDVATGHRFFMVDRFVHTDFEKDSPNGLMRTKFFDLRNYMDLVDGKLPDIDRIADNLRGKKWKADKQERK